MTEKQFNYLLEYIENLNDKLQELEGRIERLRKNQNMERFIR